jgi:hypothetical protein
MKGMAVLFYLAVQTRNVFILIKASIGMKTGSTIQDAMYL